MAALERSRGKSIGWHFPFFQIWPSPCLPLVDRGILLVPMESSCGMERTPLLFARKNSASLSRGFRTLYVWSFWDIAGAVMKGYLPTSPAHHRIVNHESMEDIYVLGVMHPGTWSSRKRNNV